MEELILENDEENELFEHFNLTLSKGQELLRIDKFLMTRIENATRSKLQAAANAGISALGDLIGGGGRGGRN